MIWKRFAHAPASRHSFTLRTDCAGVRYFIFVICYPYLTEALIFFLVRLKPNLLTIGADCCVRNVFNAQTTVIPEWMIYQCLQNIRYYFGVWGTLHKHGGGGRNVLRCFSHLGAATKFPEENQVGVWLQIRTEPNFPSSFLKQDLSSPHHMHR